MLQEEKVVVASGQCCEYAHFDWEEWCKEMDVTFV
jgi:hypothetical protein